MSQMRRDGDYRMRIELSIPILPKLPNRLLGAHWTIRSGHAKKWRRLIQDALTCAEYSPVTPNGSCGNKVALGVIVRAHLTLTRCSPRQCDFDGLVGSFKPCIDALVKCGIIEDDTPKHIQCSYEWTKTPRKEQGIKIVVEAI